MKKCARNKATRHDNVILVLHFRGVNHKMSSKFVLIMILKCVFAVNAMWRISDLNFQNRSIAFSRV